MSSTANPTTAPSSTASTTARVLLALALWGAAAVAVAATGALADVPRPAVPASIAGPTVLTLALFWRSARLRAWLERLDVRWLLSVHLVRVVAGAAFLVLLQRGELPELFALRGGVGDIVAGVLAMAAIGAVTAGGKWGRPALWVFNVVGLVDMLMVVATAQYLLFVVEDVVFLAAMAPLPFGVLPTFVVPLVLLTHIGVFYRLTRRRAEDGRLSRSS